MCFFLKRFCLFPKWSCLSHCFWIEFLFLCFSSLNVLNLEISSVLLISPESEVLLGTLLTAASCCSQGSYTLIFCEFYLPNSKSPRSIQDLQDGLWLLQRESISSFVGCHRQWPAGTTWFPGWAGGWIWTSQRVRLWLGLSVSGSLIFIFSFLYLDMSQDTCVVLSPFAGGWLFFSFWFMLFLMV